jgi:hypothetical protein
MHPLGSHGFMPRVRNETSEEQKIALSSVKVVFLTKLQVACKDRQDGSFALYSADGGSSYSFSTMPRRDLRHDFINASIAECVYSASKCYAPSGSML